jgi:nucleotide-binding universal stress UspA family protein
VGFDGSDSARVALEWAVDEARLHDATLEVWAVLEPPPQGLPHEAGDDAVVREELRAATMELTAGIAAEFRPGWGGAAAELCAACTDSDLLVVGSRGRSPFAGLLLGSVSRACLQHAPCSVAVIHTAARPARPHGRVVVGIDTSGHSRHALRVAAEEARLRGAALHAIHAVHWDHLGVELIEPTTAQLIRWGRNLVRTELAGSGVAARTVVLNGNPSDVLARRSANADLLVLGSRGHNPLAALALGSTSDYCVRHAACPVLIVRPGHDDAAALESSSP